MSMSMKNCVCWVMTVGSSHPATASSSHINSSSAYFARYCEAGLGDFAISAISSLVMRVLTEMSTVVTVILCQGEVRTMCPDSGSHQKLNSRRFWGVPPLGAVGAMPPPQDEGFLGELGDLGMEAIGWGVVVRG